MDTLARKQSFDQTNKECSWRGADIPLRYGLLCRQSTVKQATGTLSAFDLCYPHEKRDSLTIASNRNAIYRYHLFIPRYTGIMKLHLSMDLLPDDRALLYRTTGVPCYYGKCYVNKSRLHLGKH